ARAGRRAQAPHRRGGEIRPACKPRPQPAMRLRLRCRRQPRERRRPEAQARARGRNRPAGMAMTSLQCGIVDWIEASQRTPGEVYAHKLELAAAADRAGFHAYMLAEHQGTPLSINASPSVLLSPMIQRTQRLRLGAPTFCLPWNTPDP